MRFRLAAIVAVAAVWMAGCSHPELGGRDINSPKEAPRAPKPVAMPLSGDLQAQARAELEGDLKSSDPVTRANAVEGMQIGLGADARDQIVAAIDDPAGIVRYAACMSAGTLRLSEAKSKLPALAEGSDAHVAVAALYALHRLGDVSRSHRLEKLAVDPDPGTRADVAIALGLLGEPTGLNILRTLRQDDDFNVRAAAYEGMWRLGSKKGLQDLVALTVSQYPDDEILGVLALAGPKDRRVSGQIYALLTSDYVEVSLAAARALGELGMDDGYAVAMLHVKDRDPRIRHMAAFALGAIGRSDAQPKLAILLKDEDVRVRLAAAVAILRLNPPGDGR